MGAANLAGRLAGLFNRPRDRDGMAATLEADCLAAGRAAAGSSHHALRAPGREVHEALAQKALGSWLQNRHQTLYPLAMNFRSVTPEHNELLMGVIAASLHAGGAVDTAMLERVQGWFRTVGAGEAQMRLLARLLATQPPLSRLLAEVQKAHLSTHAYAVAAAALDQRELVNRLFLEYLAARLAIPSDMAISVAQRFRL